MLTPQDTEWVRATLTHLDTCVADCQAELTRLAGVRATLAATIRHHAGISNAALGAVLGVSEERARQLANAGTPIEVPE